ncbi:head-tail connector protein [Siminovitchia fortis]|uniref:Phage gp6-like head-tail connector protein n=1 Tax=Siminovitchia fortis TaxID=254758 RepID=A0A443IN42_9BACI|nr:head-tail connector protein [Siminovitchia fortis]RWR06746.1 phage gp6-like head-tail connector protein [Siminovitchia fortis]WHY83014.1 head-tail connector protein [Siminovitchia fortis]
MLNDVKEFLRVDGTYEDGVILSLIEAAKAELTLSGVIERKSGDPDYPLYELAIKVLVTQNYEDRGLEKRDNRVLETLILKLKNFSVAVSPNE